MLSILKKRYYDEESIISERDIFGNRHKRSEWNDLAQFLSVTYWTRLWIVQEVILARSIQIQCGDCFVEWFVMSKFLTCLGFIVRGSEYDFPQHLLDLGHTPAAKLEHFKQKQTAARRSTLEQNAARRSSLVDSLNNFANSRCGDPRDKVYGLLGLSQDEDNIYPDYQRTLLELYEMLVSMPKFRTDDGLVSFSQLIQSLFGGLFRGPGDSPQPSRLDQEVRQTEGMFYTPGTICGTIAVLGDPYTNKKQAMDLISRWQALYFHRVKSHSPPEILSTTVKDALAHVAKGFKRAVAIDSRLSDAYRGIETSDKPDWHEVVLRCDGSGRRESIQTSQCTEEYSCLPANSALPKPRALQAVIDTLNPPKDMGMSRREVCICLRTSRIPIPPRWMIGSRGQVGLVPGNAKEGDFICHFHNSDVAVVVRPFGHGRYHCIVGGAVIIRQWEEQLSKAHELSPNPFNFSVGTKPTRHATDYEDSDAMSFHFDRTTLRLLTCLPSDLEGASNDCTPLPSPAREHLEVGMKMKAAIETKRPRPLWVLRDDLRRYMRTIKFSNTPQSDQEVFHEQLEALDQRMLVENRRKGKTYGLSGESSGFGGDHPHIYTDEPE